MKTAQEMAKGIAYDIALFWCKEEHQQCEKTDEIIPLITKALTDYAAAQVELEKVSAAIRCEKVVEERVKKAIKFAKDNLATPENVKVVQEALDKARAEGFKEGWEAYKEEAANLFGNTFERHVSIMKIRAITPPDEKV